MTMAETLMDNDAVLFLPLDLSCICFSELLGLFWWVIDELPSEIKFKLKKIYIELIFILNNYNDVTTT